MFDYLIYDFDGTISDSYPWFARALVATLKEHGIDETYESALAHLKISVGHALSSYSWNCTRDEAKKEFYDKYHKLSSEYGTPVEGAEDILKFALELGKKNYIYTHTGAHATLLLKKFGLYDYFDAILDGTMGFPSKPDPTALNWFVGQQRIDRSRALMIGDRDIDVNVGRNAQLKGCLLDPDGFYPDLDCDFRIEKLVELKSIIA